MKKLVRLVRLSSKEAFRKLQLLWYIDCSTINKKFKVTNYLFLRHISWSSKWREINDIIERLSSITLIEKISQEWILIEKRENIFVEKTKFFTKTYKIKLKLSDFDFFIVLWEKKDNEIILISIFLNFV